MTSKIVQRDARALRFDQTILPTLQLRLHRKLAEPLLPSVYGEKRM